ncbi:MAG: glycosyltransferase family 4 protein [Acidobacteriota bacterium]
MRFVFLFPRFKLLSGAERLIVRLAEHTIKMGHTVTILCHTMDPTCRTLAEDAKVPVVETGKTLDRWKNRYLNATLDYFSAASLASRLSDGDAVCVFFGAALPGLAWLRKVRRRPNRCLYFCYEPPRFIYRDRDEILARLGVSALVMSPGFTVYRWLDRWFTRAADRVLTQGEFGRSEIERVYGLPSTVIPHGPEMPFMERPAWDGMTVLTVNYLHPRKRIDLFIRTIAALAARGCDARAVIVGDGPERVELVRLANDLSIADRVRFAGFVADSDLAREYANADAYLHTARLESFGLSVLDALSSGLPVVSVEEGGPAEMIEDGVTGFLAPAAPEALAAKLANISADPVRTRRIGVEASRRVAGRYSWAAGAAALIEAAR